MVWCGYPLLLVPRTDEDESSRRHLLIGREVLAAHERPHHLQRRFPKDLPYGLLHDPRHLLMVDNGSVAALIIELVGGVVGGGDAADHSLHRPGYLFSDLLIKG